MVKVIPDNQTRILALEKGEADLIWGKNMVDADALNKYRSSDRFGIAVSDPTSTRQIVLNTNNEFLADVRVRRALQHATNKKVISQGVFHGFEPPADTLYSPSLPYCDVKLEPYVYDMKRAAKLLEEAGFTRDGRRAPLMKNGRQLSLNLLYNANSVSEKTIAEYLQSEYGKLGIAVSIRGEEEQSYRDNMKNGAFDMVFNICWGTPYDPQSSLAAMRQRVYGDYAAQLGLPDQGSDRRAHHGDPHLDRRGEAPRTLRVRAQAPARRRGLHPDHVRDEQGALPQDGRQRRLPLEPVRSAVRRHDAR